MLKYIMIFLFLLAIIVLYCSSYYSESFSEMETIANSENNSSENVNNPDNDNHNTLINIDLSKDVSLKPICGQKCYYDLDVILNETNIPKGSLDIAKNEGIEMNITGNNNGLYFDKGINLTINYDETTKLVNFELKNIK